MNESMQELIEVLKKNREKCPWLKQAEPEVILDALTGETEELKQSIVNEDINNIKEEIGDVLINSLLLALIYEEKGYFKSKDVVKEAKEKIIRRKPWVFGDMKINTAEEALQKWNEIKKQEK